MHFLAGHRLRLDHAPAAGPPGPSQVSSAVAPGYGRLTVSGGENALSLETLERLAAAAEGLAADPSVRLVAITGAGTRLFSAGADLASLTGLPGAEVTARGTEACRRIAALPVPTVANGE